MTQVTKRAAAVWLRQMLEQSIVVRLWTNESWNAAADPRRTKLASYIDPVGAGYAPQLLGAEAWRHGSDAAGDRNATATATFSFAGPAPLKMRGYYVTTEDGRTLLVSDIFPAPFEIVLADDAIDVVLTSRLVIEPTAPRAIPET